MTESKSAARSDMAIPGHGVDRNAHQPGRTYPMPDAASRGEVAIRENFHVLMLRPGMTAAGGKKMHAWVEINLFAFVDRWYFMGYFVVIQSEGGRPNDCIRSQPERGFLWTKSSNIQLERGSRKTNYRKMTRRSCVSWSRIFEKRKANRLGEAGRILVH